MKNRRIIFLESFLQLFGVEKIEISRVETNKISGIAIFSDNEVQEFCWHMNEEKVPSENVIQLLDFMKKHEVVDIDKLTVSSEELFRITSWSNYKEFEKSLSEIFEIEVKMVDENEETDSFFLHD